MQNLRRCCSESCRGGNFEKFSKILQPLGCISEQKPFRCTARSGRYEFFYKQSFAARYAKIWRGEKFRKIPENTPTPGPHFGATPVRMSRTETKLSKKNRATNNTAKVRKINALRSIFKNARETAGGKFR